MTKDFMGLVYRGCCCRVICLVWRKYKNLVWGFSMGLVTVFVTREGVMFVGYIWRVVSMSIQLVWLNNMFFGYRWLETELLTRQEVNMMDVETVGGDGQHVPWLQGVGDCACDQAGGEHGRGLWLRASYGVVSMSM